MTKPTKSDPFGIQKLKFDNSQRRLRQQGVLDEAEEVLKSAVEQVTGQPKEAQPEDSVQQADVAGAQLSAEEERKPSRLMALQNELRDVIEQKEQRQIQQKLAEEEERKQKEEEQDEGKKILVQPTSRPKQGPDLFGIRRKQKGVELVKTPAG